MNKIKNIIAVSAFTLMVVALPTMVSAQWNGGNYPNGGVYQGGRYGGNLDSVANRLKDRSRDFERQVDREFNNNNRRYGNTGVLGTILGNGTYGNRGYGNDRIKRLAEDFRQAAARFENRVDDNDDRDGRYGRDDSYRNGRWNRGDARDNQAAQRLLDTGAQLERELRSMRMSSTLQYKWNAIRNDLNVVANAYGYGRGGRNNNRFPF